MNDFIDIKLILKLKKVVQKLWSISIQVSKMQLGLPLLNSAETSSLHNVPANISDLIAAKRKARKNGTKIWVPLGKKHLNFLSQKLKKLQQEFENGKVQQSQLIII